MITVLPRTDGHCPQCGSGEVVWKQPLSPLVPDIGICSLCGCQFVEDIKSGELRITTACTGAQRAGGKIGCCTSGLVAARPFRPVKQHVRNFTGENMRDHKTPEQLMTAIEKGWHIVWFGINEEKRGTLAVDLCCNWRLQDGKFMFWDVSLEKEVEPHDFIEKVRDKAENMWHNTLFECMQQAQEKVSF